MFSDLVGSTALSARMDPEDLREVISAYQNCVAETVRRFDGFVAKLVYFGYPQAHEDDAEREVPSGLELVSAVNALQTPGPRRSGGVALDIGSAFRPSALTLAMVPLPRACLALLYWAARTLYACQFSDRNRHSRRRHRSRRDRGPGLPILRVVFPDGNVAGYIRHVVVDAGIPAHGELGTKSPNAIVVSVISICLVKCIGPNMAAADRHHLVLFRRQHRQRTNLDAPDFSAKPRIDDARERVAQLNDTG
jgi:hypothetical protein